MERVERWMIRHERSMYPRGRPNRLAIALNRGWATIGAAGLGRGRLVTLEVAGRRTGRPVSLPLIVADVDGERYLVAMLGDRAEWVANVRAAGGRAILRSRRREPVQLVEVEPTERAPVLKRHLQVAPAARAFVPVDRHARVAEFERIAGRFPVFRIQPIQPSSEGGARPAAAQHDRGVER